MTRKIPSNSVSSDMPSVPDLSICIPTFQRSHLLSRTLERIAACVIHAGWQSRVELCVSDNASGDSTPEVLAAFRSPGLQFRSSRNAQNLGFSRNLRQVAKLAQGKYILFVGDDDLLCWDALLNLDGVFALEPEIALFPTLPDLPLDLTTWDLRTQPHWLEGGRSVLRELGLFQLTFLGNFIVRRDTYLANDTERYAASLYPHAAILFRILQTSRAFFSPTSLFEFDEPVRGWNQPLLTAIDLARIITEEVLIPVADQGLARDVYSKTVRSIVRALINRRKGRTDEVGNPFADLSLRNVLQCYRASRAFQIQAAAFWAAGAYIPLAMLLKLIGEKPRKVNF